MFAVLNLKDARSLPLSKALTSSSLSLALEEGLGEKSEGFRRHMSNYAANTTLKDLIGNHQNSISPSQCEDESEGIKSWNQAGRMLEVSFDFVKFIFFFVIALALFSVYFLVEILVFHLLDSLFLAFC